MRIYDNHVHLSPTGMGVEAPKLFEEAGEAATAGGHYQTCQTSCVPTIPRYSTGCG